jgi:GDP-L-fucose synthase
MNSNSKIFVAGGTGMVGSAIIRKLSSLKYRNIISNFHRRKPGNDLAPGNESVRFVKLDLTDQKSVDRFFKKEKPEYVFLAAAKVGGIIANSTYQADFIYENIMIAANVVHAAYLNKVIKLLNLGSSCIYPKFSAQPMKEEYLLTGELEPTNEPYAIAKIAAIKLCRYYNEQYGTNFISVMPSNLYGQNDNFNLETSHVLPALIRKFYLAKLLKENNKKKISNDLKRFSLGFGVGWGDEKISYARVKNILKKIGISGEYVELWGSGEVFREFLHVEDLSDACVYLMNHYNAKEIGEFINVGSGEEIQLKDLAEMIKNAVGFEGKIRYDKSKPDGMFKKLLDISRIRKLGWKPKVSLKEGLQKTIHWYSDRQSRKH